MNETSGINFFICECTAKDIVTDMLCSIQNWAKRTRSQYLKDKIQQKKDKIQRKNSAVVNRLAVSPNPNSANHATC